MAVHRVAGDESGFLMESSSRRGLNMTVKQKREINIDSRERERYLISSSEGGVIVN